MEIGFLLLVFGLGTLVSFFSSFMSGGLGALSLMVLLALGLSPHAALGTFRVGALGFALGGLMEYVKAGKIIWPAVLPLSIIGIVGALIGVEIVLSIEEDLLEKIIGLAILAFIPFTIWKPQLGLRRQVTSLSGTVLGYVTSFIAAVWGGSLTIGTGIITLYSGMYFFGWTLLEVKGTNRIPALAKSVASLILFALAGFVDWQIGVFFALGMALGGMIGTGLSIKLGDKWLQRILLITIVALSTKLIFGF